MKYEKVERFEQLDALPIGAVYMETDWSDWETDPCPNVWLRLSAEDWEEPTWAEFGGSRDWPTDELRVPGIVLWRPAENH